MKYSDFIMLFKNDETEISLFRDGMAIIKGTSDVMVARTIYAGYIGNENYQTKKGFLNTCKGRFE